MDTKDVPATLGMWDFKFIMMNILNWFFQIRSIGPYHTEQMP